MYSSNKNIQENLMTYAPLIIEEKKKKELLDLYHQFMKDNHAEAKIYSLNEFKQSDIYQDLPDEEKERLNKLEGKKVKVLIFETAEQAIEFIEKLQSKGLIDQKQAEQHISRLNEQAEASNSPRM
ncbi:MAG: hypothetical protein J0I93_06500 [Legionella sp.]|nr:hypothetical protein [Legionella sp.]